MATAVKSARRRTARAKDQESVSGQDKPAAAELLDGVALDSNDGVEAAGALQRGLLEVGVSISKKEIGDWDDLDRAEVRGWLRDLQDPSMNLMLPEVLRGRLPAGWKRPGAFAGALCTPSAEAAIADVLSTPASETQIEVSIDLVDASPLNPRTYFDKDKLEQLGESIKKHGQLNPVLAWQPKSGRYEIIDGERRWRALKLKRIGRIRLKVLQVTEEEAIELRGIANLEREDLTPIETARWYQQLMDRCGYTQTSLAKRLGVSQGQISNMTRLLELPEEWQQRIITREIPATHARAIVPWMKYPGVLKELAGIIKLEGIGSFNTFEGDVLEAAVDASRPLAGYYYDRKRNRSRDVALSKTDAAREDLQVVDLKRHHGKRAFNVALWEELQAAGEKRRQERASKASERTEAKEPAPKLTAAEKAQRAKEQSQQFSKRLYRYKVGWLQRFISQILPGASDVSVWKLLLFFAVQDSRQRSPADLSAGVKEAGGQVKLRSGYYRGADAWPTIASVPADQLGGVARQVLRHWVLHNCEDWRADLRPVDVEGIAAELGIEIERDWTLDRDFLELHSKAQLAALAEEWSVLLTGPKRPQMIEQLLQEDTNRRANTKRGFACPKELVKVKAPK